MPEHFRSAAITSGCCTTCLKCGDPISLFALGDEDQIHRRLASGVLESDQSRQQCRLRAFLICSAAANDNFSESRFVDQAGFKRRRRPFGRIGLFHVVHEIQPVGARCAGIQYRENAGLPIRIDALHAIESGFAQIAHGEIAALRHAAILSRDRRLADPLLQPRHRFVVMLFDFGVYGLQLGSIRGRGGSHRSERSSARESSTECSLQKCSPVKW